MFVEFIVCVKSICGICQCNDVVLGHLFVNKSCYIVKCFVGVMLWLSLEPDWVLNWVQGLIWLYCTILYSIVHCTFFGLVRTNVAANEVNGGLSNWGFSFMEDISRGGLVGLVDFLQKGLVILVSFLQKRFGDFG